MNVPDRTIPGGSVFRLFAIFGLIAPLLTFAIAISSLSAEQKIAGLAVVAIAYGAICFWAYRKQINVSIAREHTTEDAVGDRLAALDEANHFFGASLNQSDMFRLVSSRVREIIPMESSALFAVDAAGENLALVAADGINASVLEGYETAVEKGLAGMAVLSGEIEIDADLSLEKTALPDEALENLRSAAAIPLIHEDRVFAVFEIFSSNEIGSDSRSKELLESVGHRITPLFLGSFALDRSMSSALTDSLTSLPNERAFFMVLENQLAESMRYRDERPLTVVTIDVKDFAAANQDHGHSTGDRILGFVADGIKGELRKMDFLARSFNDEFVIILPTANEQMAQEIVERIRTFFAENAFEISENDTLKLWLHFGLATFWKDGETPQQLLQNAQLRKRQAKAEDPDNVVWFPKEYVN